ncbi:MULTISPECIES: flagellar motor switch protein FliN [Rahnella]|jgi:flagellar motor switch protein FliN|uniref:Flagellar motor switch protein FliN n=1 Tax=Rahnella variigena TaxID=574964 RepID=A0ABX9Q318_9GAMM|nr:MULTISPECIES: flagellar motor switch protein FliN [Rahnella]MDH2897419.1 flagellar motor switch protein FliN [Rahnella variigena]RBQ33334.1 flagellar motor switch protein FliN [Rahnella aquatilis]RJT50492.1 flagellar motor switch protein FliN [Rahnella variigena]RKF70774.1 flagellar motor switch protein FliN [Rahnella variigena]RYJ18883.1 flagellar motor switch protein FliN [Rahnella variigena]
MTDTTTSGGSDKESIDDLWGDAMSEQQAADNSSTKEAQVTNFSEDLNLILDIPVKMTVELGRTKMTIKELLRLSQGSVVSLEGLAGEPLDILINGYLIAQGEVVVVSDKFGVRITDIITPSERMYRLSR